MNLLPCHLPHVVDLRKPHIFRKDGMWWEDRGDGCGAFVIGIFNKPGDVLPNGGIVSRWKDIMYSGEIWISKDHLTMALAHGWIMGRQDLGSGLIHVSKK